MGRKKRAEKMTAEQVVERRRAVRYASVCRALRMVSRQLRQMEAAGEVIGEGELRSLKIAIELHRGECRKLEREVEQLKAAEALGRAGLVGTEQATVGLGAIKLRGGEGRSA